MRRQETWTLLICILHACVHEVCMHVNLCVARTDPDIIVDVVCACVSLRLSVCEREQECIVVRECASVVCYQEGPSILLLCS